MVKINLLLRIARQVEGEYVFADVEKAHVDIGCIMEYMVNNELPKVANIQNVDCVIEYGILRDVELEGI